MELIKKVFGQMIITQIISAMTVMICMLIDNIMIGRFLGVDSMSAYGFASPVLLVFAAIGSMLSAGIQVMCGKTMGTGDSKGTNKCFSTSVAATIIISMVGLLVVVLFSSPLCTLLGAGENSPDNPVFKLTKDYLRGFIIGAPAFMFAQVMVPYMQMSGSRTRLIVAVVVMTVGDVAFDCINVFVLKWGTFGMGLASSLSYYIALMIGVGYFFKDDCIFSFKKKYVQMKVFIELLKFGVPTLVNQLSLVLLTYTLNTLLNSIEGHLAVASYTAITATGNICYSFSSGVASVALMLSSMLYIDEDKASLNKLVHIMVIYATVICLAVTAVVILLAKPMIALFSEDPHVREIASKGMRLFVLSLVPCALNTSFKNYYQGIDRVSLTQSISVMQNFALTALSAFVLSRFMGLNGVWLGFLCGEVLTLIIITIIVAVKNGKFSLTSEAFAMLPKGYGAAAEDHCEMTIVSQEEIVPSSKKAEEFCLSRGLSPRISKLIALSTEELAYNIVEYGFGKDKSGKMIEVRIIMKDGSPILRIRDNCTNFDPMDYLKMHSEDDPTAHIGLRMIMKLVKEANYFNSLGLNDLTLVL